MPRLNPQPSQPEIVSSLRRRRKPAHGFAAQRRSSRDVNEALRAAYLQHCPDRATFDALRVCLHDEEEEAAS